MEVYGYSYVYRRAKKWHAQVLTLTKSCSHRAVTPPPATRRAPRLALRQPHVIEVAWRRVELMLREVAHAHAKVAAHVDGAAHRDVVPPDVQRGVHARQLDVPLVQPAKWRHPRVRREGEKRHGKKIGACARRGGGGAGRTRGPSC